MKPPVLISCLFSLLILVSCVRDPEPIPADPPHIPENSITIISKQSGTPLSDVFVGLALSRENRDLDAFVHTGTTNANGELKFEDLDRITCYLAAVYGDLNNNMRRTDSFDFDSLAHQTRYVYF